MPQFDFYSFSVQTFWFLLNFSFLYFFILKFYVSKLSETLKMRSKLLSYNNSKNFINNKFLNLYDLHMISI